MPVDRRAAQRQTTPEAAPQRGACDLLLALVAGIGVGPEPAARPAQRERASGRQAASQAHAAGADPRLPADRGPRQQPDAPRQQREAQLLDVSGAGVNAGHAVPVRRRHLLRTEARPDHLEPGRPAHDPDHLVPGRKVLWRYGHSNIQGSSPGYLHTPDDAYLLPNGLVTVADAYNCRVLFINHAHKIVRQYGTTGVCRHDPPRNSARSTARRRSRTAERSSARSTAPGSTTSVRTGGCAGRYRRRCRIPSDPQLLGPAASCSPTTRDPDTRSS